MNSDATAPSQSRGATRSSLACLPCRSRHLKCDATRPQCNRCLEVARQCQYAPSRRGGLDRAALAERRRRRLALAGNITASDSARISPTPQAAAAGPPDGGSTSDRAHDQVVAQLASGGSDGNGSSTSESCSGPQAHTEDIDSDALVASYYSSFHRFHPFVLPRRSLIRLYRNSTTRFDFTPLVAVMRLVGHVYTAKELCSKLNESAEACILQTSPTDPVAVQCRLLYSIVLFWHNYKGEANREIRAAVKLAIDLKMFCQEFAGDYGAGDPVLTESWRRTWWMLYIVDAYFAGTLGTMNFAVVNIEATVDLPCEEREYELEQIPVPKSLADFDCREFEIAAEGASFSSFAYLIGAVRCAAFAISISPKIAAKHDSAEMVQSADSIIDGWSLLLPKDRKQVMAQGGEIDELMFQASLVIHVATIGLHRPLSDLRFNPVEDVSSCARDPPADNPMTDLVNIHTTRVLRSVEGQIRLLALPARPFHHSPFVTCMASEGTLALLSACAFQLSGEKLAVARDQIRMTIGCLGDLGELWPRTARNVHEIKTIARHVLGLGSPRANSANSMPGSLGLPGLPGGEGRGGLECDSVAAGMQSSTVSFGSSGAMEDVCGWYNLSDLGPDLEQWIRDGS